MSFVHGGTTPIDSPLDDRQPRRLPWLILALALLPALLAIWCVPWFVTQDGPAHIYNAHILNTTLRSPSAFRGVYEVHWEPLPNWGGHVLAMLTDATLPPWAAERVLTTSTLVALASACFWLRRRVKGPGGEITSAALSTLLALNVTWLLGFTGYLLGSALFPITLGVWWKSLERTGPLAAIRLGLLLTLGYFCHPISLGLTVFGVGILTLLSGRDLWRRCFWAGLAMLPLIPLGLAYLSLTRRGGPMQPIWGQLTNVFSWSDWKAHLGWIDPITLSGRQFAPFSTSNSRWFALIAPAYWLLIGLTLILFAMRRTETPDRSRRPWLVLAGLLLGIGLISPDTLGENHGHYLPQRIILLGLVSLVPALDLAGRTLGARAGRTAVIGALLLQSLWVWDYARDCTRVSTSFMTATSAIGQNQRIGTVLADTRNRFRINPLLHLDCLFGVDTENIVWSNYETGYYYFPVQLRHSSERPAASDFEAIARLVGPQEAKKRAKLWEQLLTRHSRSIDVVVSYGHDTELERINSDRYSKCSVVGDGSVRIWSIVRPIEPAIRELDLSRTSDQPAHRR